MRWSNPLVALLALFVAVSCDQQPVEPVQDELADSPALFTVVGNQPIFSSRDFQWTGDICGYDTVDCEVSERAKFQDWADASGGGHYRWWRSASSTCVGQGTGYTWYWNERNSEQSQYADDFTPDEWFYVNHKGRMIGQGSIPNFRMGVRGHYVINANGVMVVDKFDAYCIVQGD